MGLWSLERRQFEIAIAIAAVATKHLVAVGTKMLVGHAVGRKCSHFAGTVGLIIVLEIKETIDQTNEFWYNLGLSAVATQVIPHIYSLPEI